MNKDEALHKALKVLNCLNNNRVYETAWVKGAINACEEALEQPAQKPVAKCVMNSEGRITEFYDYKWIQEISFNEQLIVSLYTHPHQWQGLTDDEIDKIVVNSETLLAKDIAHAIEQTLKEKNHGT
jgi:hypothetical protein